VIIAAFCGVFGLVWRHVRQETDRSARQYVASETDQNVSEADDFSDNPVESLHAVEVFARRGKEAVPRLRAELSAADPKSRSYALLGLATIGSAAADAVDQVRELLTDESPPVRANAIGALRSMTRNSDEAGEAASRMLADPNEEVREAAAAQLLVIGPRSTENVLEVLKNELPAARGQALRVLRDWKQPRPEGGPNWLAKISDPLRSLMGDPDLGVRIEALSVLMTWHLAEPTEIRGSVGGLLDDPDPGVRAEALTTIVKLGLPEPAEIYELLQSEDADRVGVALGATRRLGECALDFLPDVIALVDRFSLEDWRGGGRHTSLSLSAFLETLESMKAPARSAAPCLIRLAEARQGHTRMQIIKTLVAIGTETDDVVGVLTPLLLDEDRVVVWGAGRLLIDVDPAAARREVSRLIPQLRSGSNVSISVLHALGALGREAREARPKVAALVNSDDQWVSHFARMALSAIGPDATAEPSAGR
jgi:HEAT repeat protein